MSIGPRRRQHATIDVGVLDGGPPELVQRCEHAAFPVEVAVLDGFRQRDAFDLDSGFGELQQVIAGERSDAESLLGRRGDETLLTEAREPVATDTLLRAFAAAELRSTPYAFARDVTGESTVALIEADPRAVEGSRPVLSDPDWLRLQAICGG